MLPPLKDIIRYNLNSSERWQSNEEQDKERRGIYMHDE
jgi:hypothetical protein